MQHQPVFKLHPVRLPVEPPLHIHTNRRGNRLGPAGRALHARLAGKNFLASYFAGDIL